MNSFRKESRTTSPPGCLGNPVSAILDGMTPGRMVHFCTALAVCLIAAVVVGRALSQQNPEAVIFGACPDVAAFLGSSGGYGHVLNPVFATPADIDAAVRERRPMLDCLESLRYRTVQPDWFRPVREHLELFVLFADAGSRELIDLATVDDPAVRRLREDVGLAPPAGLVFVRYFESTEVLPELLRPAFESPETRAVTIGSRWVAVLTQSGLPAGPAARRALETTFSHEMVHVFLNAGLDWEDASRGFPSWFHEGMAIHFSRSGRAHVGVEPGGMRVRVGPTSEYERYERVFRYLENSLGQAGFHRTIRAVVADADAGVLLEAAGVETWEDLAAEAERWWRWWPLPPGLVAGRYVWVLVAALAVLSAVAVRLWRRWQPAVPGSTLEVTLNRNLLAAVREGDVQEVRYMLRSGADPNARDGDGWPVLLWAVRAGRADVVDLLVDRGARVDADVRHAAAWHDDPDIERVIADAATRQREVW